MKKILALFFACIFCFSFSVLSLEENSNEAIDYVLEKEIMQGYENGSIKAESEITRAEFCQIMINAFPEVEKEELEVKFTDISGHWAKDVITEANKRGYINGYSEIKFGPDKSLTYEQAIAIILRADGYILRDYPQNYLVTAMKLGISDNVPVITGKNISRGEVAQLFYNLFSKEDYDYLADAGSYDKSAAYYGGGGGGTGGAIAPSAPAPMPTQPSLPDVQNSNVKTEAEEAYFYPVPDNRFNTEEYSSETENIFKNAADSPFSTFSLDVDTASYSNVRRLIMNSSNIPKDAVRIEEMINYFNYDLERPENGQPFSVTTEVHKCPWNEENYLAMVALQGYDIKNEDLPPSNLVFLIDVSGSMYSNDKLPLLQRSMFMLTDNLSENDKVSLVIYAGSTGVVLKNSSDKEEIQSAIMKLRAGGSTNGAGGIKLAYETARECFVENGNNRVILCTDGDFNVGQTSESELEELIVNERESGVFLSVLGFGMGNYKDNKMETLSDKGNGNYAYIDNLKEAKKVLVDNMTSTIFAIAKDVKLQLEFNPETVLEYRLIGYENRILNKEDFDNDKKDAGEMGAGHSMIAFYEIKPNTSGKVTSDSKYQKSLTTGSSELMNIKLRYKKPDSDTSELMEEYFVEGESEITTETFNFASAVAEFGLLIKDSEYKGNAAFDSLINRAYENLGSDKFGYRAEFVGLADLVKLVTQNKLN